mmetsp:Transcript_78755/g.96309  ORF Transcript_78755/g.96309 Transcript_78755/m.96309 type:complete len:119 (-) Transcript_78755:440-796(-)
MSKAADSNKKSKVWDEDSIYLFTEHMEQEISDMLENSDFESKFVNSWVEQIVDVAQKKLKDMKKPNYKYVTDVIILPKGSGYKKNTAFWWQPKTDKAITVKVDTEQLHCLLVAYCVQV